MSSNLETILNKNFCLIAFHGKTKGNRPIFLYFSVAYTSVAETGKMGNWILTVSADGSSAVTIDGNESLIFIYNEDYR